jgi:hypothetical protein
LRQVIFQAALAISLVAAKKPSAWIFGRAAAWLMTLRGEIISTKSGVIRGITSSGRELPRWWGLFPRLTQPRAAVILLLLPLCTR